MVHGCRECMSWDCLIQTQRPVKQRFYSIKVNFITKNFTYSEPLRTFLLRNWGAFTAAPKMHVCAWSSSCAHKQSYSILQTCISCVSAYFKVLVWISWVCVWMLICHWMIICIKPKLDFSTTTYILCFNITCDSKSERKEMWLKVD